jgi:hypothetical protein
MSKKQSIPGIYMKLEWASILEELSNEQVGIITKNLFRLVEERELLEMDITARLLFKATFGEVQAFNIKRYNEVILTRSENGKLGGAPKGNQNAKKKSEVEENNQKQAKQAIDIPRHTDKESIKETESISSISTNNSIYTSNDISKESNIVELISKQVSSSGIVESENKKKNNSYSSSSLPPGAMTTAEYERRKNIIK